MIGGGERDSVSVSDEVIGEVLLKSGGRSTCIFLTFDITISITLPSLLPIDRLTSTLRHANNLSANSCRICKDDFSG